MSDPVAVRSTEAIRTGPDRRADLPVVGLAVCAWLGATVAASVPVPVVLGAAACAVVVATAQRHRSAGPVAARRARAGPAHVWTGRPLARRPLAPDHRRRGGGGDPRDRSRAHRHRSAAVRRALGRATPPRRGARTGSDGGPGAEAGRRPGGGRGVVEAQADPPDWMVARHRGRSAAGRVRGGGGRRRAPRRGGERAAADPRSGHVVAARPPPGPPGRADPRRRPGPAGRAGRRLPGVGIDPSPGRLRPEPRLRPRRGRAGPAPARDLAPLRRRRGAWLRPSPSSPGSSRRSCGPPRSPPWPCGRPRPGGRRAGRATSRWRSAGSCSSTRS